MGAFGGLSVAGKIEALHWNKLWADLPAFFMHQLGFEKVSNDEDLDWGKEFGLCAMSKGFRTSKFVTRGKISLLRVQVSLSFSVF